MLSSALLGALALGACNTDTLPTSDRASRPLPARLVSDMEQKNMDKDSPILIRTFKQEAELEVWKQDRTGHFALLKTYPICRWSGELGPKIKEGDRQAPEGFYTITPGQMNPKSHYYLSFDLGYPNAFDRAHGRTGSNLMVHGDCSSRGCYSMTDEQISEIYALGRDAFFGGQRAFQVQAYPFRMTPENMARHRNNPNFAFWKMLKRGYDHFEVTRLEPKVNVCEKRYVFDAQSPGNPDKPLSFSPAGKCPVYEVPQEIASAVQEKEARDEQRFAELVRRGTPTAPIRTYADGGMHPVFAAAVKRHEIGGPPPVFSLASAPGTIPAHVNPPRTAEFGDAPAVTASAPNAQPVAEANVNSSPAAPSGGLFGGWFGSKSEATGSSDSTSPFGRMARAMGLQRDEPKPEAKSAPAPKAKPAAHQAPTRTSGPVRPQASPAPAAAHVDQRPAAAAPDSPPAQPRVASDVFPPPPPPRTAQASSSATSSTLPGAAPVVPAGTFENRWSGFR
jgi:murein L,D-transpeptidase YafK